MAVPPPVAISLSERAVLSCAVVKLHKTVAFPVEVTAPVRLALVVTVAAFPVTLPAIAFVAVMSVNQPFTIRVPVDPICPEESVASIEAAAQGVGEDVIACVCAVAVEFVELTVFVHGVAIVVAKLPVPLHVTAPVKVIV